MRIIEEFDDYLTPEDQERLLDPIGEGGFDDYLTPEDQERLSDPIEGEE